MLNSRGGIECDFTVTRLAEDRFSIVTGTAFGNHDREWIRRHLPDDGSVQVHDVTSQWACFGVWGPKARDVLQPLTPQDLGNEAFPYMSGSARSPSATCRCGRCGSPTSASSAGSSTAPRSTDSASGGRCGRPASPMGWSPPATARSTRCGSRRAIWSGGPTSPPTRPRTRPVSASRSSSTRRAASSAARRWSRRRSRGPRKRLVTILLEDPRSVALGNEPVRIGGEICGRVTTGGYGYTVERSIAYAYVPPEQAEPGTAVEIEIFGSWIGGEIAEGPLFDPKGERIRA